MTADIEAAPPPIASVRPVAERRKALSAALEGAGDEKHFVPAEGGYLEVPVVEVEAEQLIYRVDNGRILLELDEAAKQRETATEALKEEADTIEVQRLLHALLIDKAHDPAGPIYAELETHAQQTEPLMVRRDGMVLNGNRRLAAMRELSARSPARFGHFSTARVAVLPEALDEKALEFIEAALQMAPDLKLHYGWINRRLKLRQHAADLDRARIVAAYRFAGASEIDEELGQLALAETYLSWIDAPRRYALVGEHEELFVALHQQLGELPGDHLRELWRLLGYSMIEAAPTIDVTLTHYYPFTEPKPPAVRNWVPRTMAEDRGLCERQKEGENQPIGKELAARLCSLIDDPRQAARTARAVVALSDTLKANQQKLLGITRLMGQLRGARQILQDLKLDALSPKQLRSVRAEIAALDQHVRALESGDEGATPAKAKEHDLAASLRQTWKRAKERLGV